MRLADIGKILPVLAVLFLFSILPPQLSIPMSGVGVLCFAASYAVAFLLECALLVFYRLRLANGHLLWAITAWGVAGFVAHSAYLFHKQAIFRNAIDSMESFFFVTAWGLVLLYLYLRCFRPKIPFGLILWPLVLGLIWVGAAAAPPDGADVTPEGAVSPVVLMWKRIHVATFFLTTISVCIGFVAGLAYLIQNRLLRSKLPPRFLTLPSLEWSLSVCRQSIGASIFLLGASIFFGLLLTPDRQNFLYWNDPLVVGTVTMFAFLLLFSGSLIFRRWKTEGNHVATLTLFAFWFLITILLLGIFSKNAHWQRPVEQVRQREQVRSWCGAIKVEKATTSGSETSQSLS